MYKAKLFTQTICCSPDYRFGFNGMLRDDDVRDKKLTSDNEGRGNSYDFGARILDPRVGRFLSLDPLMGSFPWQSPYLFAGNDPVNYIDWLGFQPKKTGAYSGQGEFAPLNDSETNTQFGWVWNEEKWFQKDVIITSKQLTSLFPKGNSELLKSTESQLNLFMDDFGIDDYWKLSAFIAECGFESQGYTKTSENMNYSLKGIRENFKRMKKYSDIEINEFRKDKNILAAKLYGGNKKGKDYRGRGLIQTTWESNYKIAQISYNKFFGTNYNFIDSPFLLSNDYQIAVRTSMIFFKNNIFNDKHKIVDINDVSIIINRYDSKSFKNREQLFDKVFKSFGR